MKYSLLAALLLLVSSVIAQKHPACDLINHYGEIFRAEYYAEGDYKTVFTFVDSLRKDDCLAGLVNPNVMLIDYFLKHYANIDREALLAFAADPIKLQKRFIKDLQTNAAFNGLMQTFAARYLEPAIAPKDSLKMDNVLNIAVKFFNIQKITPEGYYAIKVCVGINGIKTTEAVRNPQLEAFCFAAILKHYESSQFDLKAAFTAAAKELYKVNMGIDEKERQLRAQGAMYFLMRENPVLRKVLLYEYGLRERYLPFVIVG
jgi:hypothetical protein